MLLLLLWCECAVLKNPFYTSARVLRVRVESLFLYLYIPCLFTYLQKRPVTLEQNVSFELVTKILTKIRSSRTSCSFFFSIVLCIVYSWLTVAHSRGASHRVLFGMRVLVFSWVCVFVCVVVGWQAPDFRWCLCLNMRLLLISNCLCIIAYALFAIWR